MDLPVKAIYTIDGEQVPVDYTPRPAPSVTIVKDEHLVVPPKTDGEFFQILHDFDVLGAPRQVVDGMIEKFDFPAVVNKDWGLRTRYPGYTGREYTYEELPDDFCRLYYELLEWASSYRLPKGRISGYYTSRDGGTQAIIDPEPGSMLWVWVDVIMDGKSHTDAVNVEHGARDPITGRNPNAKQNFAWLMRPCTGQLCRKVEDRGSDWGYEVLDITKPAPSLDYVLARPWLYGWANAASRTKVGKRYVVSDYPQIDKALKALDPGMPRTGTPILNMGKGPIVWIRKNSCTPLLAPGSRWSPYVPEK